MGRFAQPAEMCAAVGFLASQEAGYILSLADDVLDIARVESSALPLQVPDAVLGWVARDVLVWSRHRCLFRIERSVLVAVVRPWASLTWAEMPVSVCVAVTVRYWVPKVGARSR